MPPPEFLGKVKETQKQGTIEFLSTLLNQDQVLCMAVLALLCLGLSRGIESCIYLIILEYTAIHNTHLWVL